MSQAPIGIINDKLDTILQRQTSILQEINDNRRLLNEVLRGLRIMNQQMGPVEPLTRTYDSVLRNQIPNYDGRILTPEETESIRKALSPGKAKE